MAQATSQRATAQSLHLKSSLPSSGSRPMWRRLLGNSFIHIVLLVGGFVWIYPFLFMLAGSLRSPANFFSEGLSVIPHELDLANFVHAWQDANFGQYFFNSVLTTGGTVTLTLLISSAAGYALARTQFFGKRIVLGIIAVTLFLPQTYTIIPLFDLIQKLGLLDSLWSVILVETAGSVVFSTFLFIGFFTTLDKEIEDAAAIDGANFHQRFLFLALPLARPMIATVALFTFISAWNNFLIPLIFTLGNPSLRTLAVGLYAFVGEHATNWTYLCAGAVITLVPIMLVFVFLQRFFINAIAGAIK